MYRIQSLCRIHFSPQHSHSSLYCHPKCKAYIVVINNSFFPLLLLYFYLVHVGAPWRHGRRVTVSIIDVATRSQRRGASCSDGDVCVNLRNVLCSRLFLLHTPWRYYANDKISQVGTTCALKKYLIISKQLLYIRNTVYL